MKYKNLQKNKACPPSRGVGSRRGFVILFAVTLSSILLSIALGVANIALKEIKFSTSAKDANDAFFAADTGIECALMNDKGASSAFPMAGSAGPITCAGSSIPLTFTSIDANHSLYNFVVTGLGSSVLSCANVSVAKDNISQAPGIVTKVTSKGYNIGNASCLSSNPNRIERTIETNY